MSPTSERDILSCLEGNLQKYQGGIWSLTENRKAATLGIDLRRRIKDFRGDMERQYVENCSTLLCIPSLFREKELVISETSYQACDEPARVALCYKQDILSREASSFKLVCEGTTVFECDSFVDAVLGLMMAIYTFNLAYPRQLEKTLLLLQKVFLGVDDERAIDKKILKVMVQIKQAM